MSGWSYYGETPNPLWDALLAITGVEPPDYVRGLYSASHLEDRVDELQSWCSENARPHWATGLSMLEAAELIVGGAVENANIPPERGDK